LLFGGLGLSLAFASAARLAARIQIEGEVRHPDGTAFSGVVVELAAYPDRAAAAAALLSGQREPIVEATRTNSSGRFLIAAPTPGVWSLRLSAEKYVPLEAVLLPLLEDEVLAPVTLDIGEAALVRVVNGTGAPIAGAMARTEGDRPSLDRRLAWRPRRSMTRAGPDGLLRIPRKSGETLAVSVFAPGYCQATVTIPGTEQVVLAASGVEPRNLMIVDGSGVGSPGVVVLAGPGQGWPVAVSGRDGTAQLTPSPLPLVLEASGGRRMEVSAAEPQQLDRIVLPPPLELRGEVHRRGTGEPLRDAAVWLTEDPGLWVVTDAQGRYRLPVSGSGAIALQAAAAGYFAARVVAQPPQMITAADKRTPTAPPLVLDRKGIVVGTVEDTNGTPIAGATVEASPRMVREVGQTPGASVRLRRLTGKDGTFRLAGLVPGTLYDVKVAADRFAPRDLEIVPELAERTTPLRVVLGRGEVVRGRVLAEDGTVVTAAVHLVVGADAQRQLFAAYGDPSRGKAEGIFSSATDTDGFFELRALPPGRFDLVAVAPGLAPVLVAGVELTPGEGVRDVGTVRLGPGAALEGVVHDARSNPVDGARVTASVVRQSSSGDEITRFSQPLGPQLTDSAGSFRIVGLLPNERVDLEVARKGFVTEQVRGVTTPAQELVVTLRPAAAVAGRVLTVSDEPLAGAHVEIAPESGGGWPERIGYVDGVTDSMGRFALRDVQPGKVRLTASVRGYRPATVRLAIVPGAELTDIDVRLSEGLAVEGRVLDARGEPVPGAAVQARGLGSAQTDSLGQYRLEGLPPGLVQLMAWHPEAGAVEQEVVLEPPGSRMDLRLSAVSVVAGKALDPNRQPVAGARVELEGQGIPGPPLARWSGKDGSFRFEAVAAGRYELTLRKAGFAPAKQRLEVRTEPIENLVVVLSEGGGITGRLIGIEASELATVTVSAQREGVAPLSGEVRSDGSYLVRNAEPGLWQVTASTGPTDRHAQGAVQVAAEASEARLDLELGKGTTVVARILLDGAPAGGAFVRITSAPNGAASAWGNVDHVGEIRLSGLVEGPNWLEINPPSLRASYSQKVQLAGEVKLTVDIRTAVLDAVVRDSDSGAPLPRAVVHVTPLLRPDDAVNISPQSFACDSEGRAVGARLYRGQYYIEATAPGYDQAATVADLTAPEPTKVELRLERSSDS
jgi:protocatechuate 3,4-dioxygenase beta subunit